jgi:hypothetical protein
MAEENDASRRLLMQLMLQHMGYATGGGGGVGTEDSTTTNDESQLQSPDLMQALLDSAATSNPNSGPPPASQTAIAELDEHKCDDDFIRRLKARGATADCVICSESFQREQYAKRMPCKHWFHTDCLHEWLLRHNTCPLCRAELPTLDAAYDDRKRNSSSSSRSSDQAMESLWSSTQATTSLSSMYL